MVIPAARQRVTRGISHSPSRAARQDVADCAEMAVDTAPQPFSIGARLYAPVIAAGSPI